MEEMVEDAMVIVTAAKNVKDKKEEEQCVGFHNRRFISKGPLPLIIIIRTENREIEQEEVSSMFSRPNSSDPVPSRQNHDDSLFIDIPELCWIVNSFTARSPHTGLKRISGSLILVSIIVFVGADDTFPFRMNEDDPN
jgi:hypothetical protein